MNLSAYDKVYDKVDKTTSWIDTNKRILYSKELSFRKYYTFVKRFEPEISSTVFFLVLSDNVIENTKTFRTKIDDYGRCKFNISSIYNDLSLNYLKPNFNVTITLDKHDIDGDIYKLNL